MTVAKSHYRDVASPLSAPKTVHPEHVLYALPDNWIVKDRVTVGYLEENYLLISSYGVFVVFPQDAQGTVSVSERNFLVGGQNQAPLLQALQESVRIFERRLGIRVQPVVLYRELQEAERPGHYLVPTRHEWEMGNVKILSWAGLKPYLQSQVSWQLNGADIMRVYKAFKAML